MEIKRGILSDLAVGKSEAKAEEKEKAKTPSREPQKQNLQVAQIRKHSKPDLKVFL